MKNAKRLHTVRIDLEEHGEEAEILLIESIRAGHFFTVIQSIHKCSQAALGHCLFSHTRRSAEFELTWFYGKLSLRIQTNTKLPLNMLWICKDLFYLTAQLAPVR